jgi:hypothetical protein
MARSIRLAALPVLALVPAVCFFPEAEAATPRARARLGMNLSEPKDYNTEVPFIDVFRMSRPWISQRKGAAWGKGPTLSLDERGWVTSLEPGCWAETLLCNIRGGHYPGGNYTVLYEGEGKIDVGGAAAAVSAAAGQMVLRVDSSKGPIFLRVTATNPRNYVRNIRVLMPGGADSYRDNPWNPTFLRRWQGMACLRFMDFMQTNNSPVSSWSERPVPEDATYFGKGVPLELLIDLANRLSCDAWFCIPHRADDDYVRHFASLVKERLDPRLKAYVEYSNEVWNSGFRQHAYAGEEGKKLGYADKTWEAAWRYTAHRSVQIFRICEEVLGGHERLVRVLPSQAASAYVSRQVASFQEAYKQADVLAIAPYLTFNIGPKTNPSATEVAGWNANRVLDHLERQALPQAVKWMHDNKAVADAFRLKLVAYEGGQHLVGIGGGENNEALTKVLQEANASPRLAGIYRRYFDAWEKADGDLFCYFSSVGTWSKWGSWGALQYADDEPSRSPKFLTIMQWAASRGQAVQVPKE